MGHPLGSQFRPTDTASVSGMGDVVESAPSEVFLDDRVPLDERVLLDDTGGSGSSPRSAPARGDHDDRAAAVAPSQFRRRGPRWWRLLRRAFELALVGGGAYALYSERRAVGEGAALLVQLRWEWVVVASIAEVASMVVFARLQRALLRAGGVRLSLWPMVEITLAGNALAVSLPGGAAWSAGFAFAQLRRRGASRMLSIWVLLVAGALSSFALFVLLVLGVELAGRRGPASEFRLAGLVLAAIPVVVGVLAVVISRSGWAATTARRALGMLERAAWGAWARRLGAAAWERATAVRLRPREWLSAFGLGGLNWVEDAGCLAASILAVGGGIPWPGVLVAYGVAQIGASLPITPGGLGVVEGSLTYALILYGMPVRDAIAAVLLYRIISFWALVPIGWGAWGLLRWAGRRREHEHPWALPSA